MHGRHCDALIEFVVDVDVPVAHEPHSVDSGADWYLPSGHALQAASNAVVDSMLPNSPAAHDVPVHSPAELLPLCFPGGQEMQVAKPEFWLPLSPYLPGAHPAPEHVSKPDKLVYFPLGHEVHRFAITCVLPSGP